MFFPCVNSLHKEGQLWELVSIQGRGMATICSMDTVSKQIPIEWLVVLCGYLTFSCSSLPHFIVSPVCGAESCDPSWCIWQFLVIFGLICAQIFLYPSRNMWKPLT
jgi:hypothetical protein